MKNKFNPPSISSTNILLLSYLAVGLLLISIIFLGRTFRIPFEYISNNPESQYGVPLYAGLLQKLRVILWSASMSVCFFTYLILRFYSPSNKVSNYILFAGILTLLLFVDDYFQIHLALRIIFHIPNFIVYLGYALFVFYIFYQFKVIIFKSEYKIFLLAFLLLGAAVLLDLLSDGNIVNLGKEDELEASFKIFGVVTWSVYFIRFCFENLKVIIKR